MTPQPQPHPLRCETCGYYKLQPEFDECMKCNHPNFKDDVFMHEIHGYEFDRIEKMGCASHSSAGAQQQRIEQVNKKLCQLGDMIHAIQYAGKVSAEVINDLDDILRVYREIREAIALLQAGDGK